jgi:hypothetical protein
VCIKTSSKGRTPKKSKGKTWQFVLEKHTKQKMYVLKYKVTQRKIAESRNQYFKMKSKVPKSTQDMQVRIKD